MLCVALARMVFRSCVLGVGLALAAEHRMTKRILILGMCSEWVAGTCKIAALLGLLGIQVTACGGSVEATERGSIAEDLSSWELRHALEIQVDQDLSTLRSVPGCVSESGYCGAGADWVPFRAQNEQLDFDPAMVPPAWTAGAAALPGVSDLNAGDSGSFAGSRVCQMAKVVDGVRYVMIGASVRGGAGVAGEGAIENVWDLQNNEFFVRGKSAVGIEVGGELSLNLDFGLGRQRNESRTIDEDMLSPRVQMGVVIADGIGALVKTFQTDTQAHGYWFGLTGGLAFAYHYDVGYAYPLTQLGLGQLYMTQSEGAEPHAGAYVLRGCKENVWKPRHFELPCHVARFAGRADLLLSMKQTVSIDPASKLALALVTAMGAQELYQLTGQRLSTLCGQ